MKLPAVSAAVIVRAGRVLLIRRARAEGDLIWQFPAGKVEPGEAVAEAAVRETREETGLKVEAVSLIGQRVHPKTGREMHYTACRVIDGKAHAAAADEVDAVAWVTLAEISEKVPYGLFGPVQEYLDNTLA
ncbi:NUDIX hydrolase [Streptomyces odontomachi]|uniref:NUDIX hydrolase n=1 Tax=Streptomyces odontomachi TaxID=2944940 RepID=UPI00210A53BF|nr:NUDIX hydrolase [Streptomyces sp. ODS25]